MEKTDNEIVFKVGSDTDIIRLCNAFCSRIKEFPDKDYSFVCVGAGALNQAVKAVTRINNDIFTKGKQVSVYPIWRVEEGDKKEESSGKPISVIHLNIIFHRLTLESNEINAKTLFV